MNTNQQDIHRFEMGSILEELGRIRRTKHVPRVDLPELYDGKGMMPGVKLKWTSPGQIRTRDVLQEHPEVYDANDGDSYHVVNSGGGIAPSGNPYSDAKPPPKAQLEFKTDTMQVYAKVGGTTILSPVKKVANSFEEIKSGQRHGSGPKMTDSQRKHALIALRSHGHHIRSFRDITTGVDVITGKYDGVQCRMTCEGSAIVARFRNGEAIYFVQDGEPIRSLDIIVEWVPPLPGEETVTEFWSDYDMIAGKVPIIISVERLNFPNIFGYDMLAALGTPSPHAPGSYSRIVFEGGEERVAARVPKVLWRRGDAPLWNREWRLVYDCWTGSGSPPTHMHGIDGLVFHMSTGGQNLSKFELSIDLDRKYATKLGIDFPRGGSKIKEYTVRHEGPHTVFRFLRDRTRESGGEKNVPNSWENINATIDAPDITKCLDFLVQSDYEDRTSEMMRVIRRKVAAGLFTYGTWRELRDIMSKDTGFDGHSLVGDFLEELIRGGAIIPGIGSEINDPADSFYAYELYDNHFKSDSLEEIASINRMEGAV